MTSAALPNPLEPLFRRWWVLAAAVWFALLSQVAVWLIDIAILSGAPHKFAADFAVVGSMAAAAFLAGAVCSWVAFRRRSSFLGTGASLGLGTAILSLIANPFAWVFSLGTFFLLPIVWVALFVLGGVGLELVLKVSTKVWPNRTVETDARKSSARGSP